MKNRMKNGMKNVLLFVVVPIAAVCLLSVVLVLSPFGKAHRDTILVRSKIAAQVRSEFPDKSSFPSLSQDGRAFQFRSKAVVIDAEDRPRGREEVFVMLLGELNARSEDYDARKPVTVFVVGDNYKKEAVGSYGGTFTAYKIGADIYALSWPDMTPIGRTRLSMAPGPDASTIYKPEPEREFNSMVESWVRHNHVP